MAKTAAEWLAEAEAAYSDALKKQSYSIAGRSKTNPDVEAAFRQVLYWQARVDRDNRGGIRVRLGTPV